MLNLKIGIFTLFFAVLPLTMLHAQETRIKGSVETSSDQKPLPQVEVHLENSSFSTVTDDSGNFDFKGEDLPLGEQVLSLKREGYDEKRYPIVVNEGETLDLGVLTMDVNLSETSLQIAEITLSDQELDNDRSSASNISGLLSSSKDIFFKAAAYDFSATFFKPRGLDNENGRVLINGIEMNKVSTGRPEYAEFGGLNDVKRNEIFYAGLNANPYQFGGIAGTTNSVMRASQYREGGKVSYAQSNRSYRGRVMASYSSGLTPEGWAYTFLASRRFGDHGYTAGTSYNTNSFFASVEKKINEKHSLNFTSFYTPYRRGKSAPITQEVRDLKGKHYNPYWGNLEGDHRNSRYKTVEEPVFMLNHYWGISQKTQLNTNVAYQFGYIGNTRIDNGGTRIVKAPDGQQAYIGGAKNPAPNYYQNLPSYLLRYDDLDGSNFQAAYLAEQKFKNDGQMDWTSLYEANEIAQRNGGNSTYIIQEDRIQNNKISANSILTSQISKHVKLNASLNYRHLHSQNYARVNDLLGGSGYLDIDFYADEPKEVSGLITELAQSDLNQPDRIAQKGDRYKYNYDINSDYASAFAQAQFSYKKIDFFIGADVSYTSYQRDGQFKNGYYPENSYGKGEKLDFTDFGIKGGLLYKISGQHMIRANGAYLTKAPTSRNTFSNARQNGYSVIGLESEKLQAANLSYIYRSPVIKARATGFYSEIKDGTDIGYYFTQGLAGLGEDHDAAFVQEMTTGINTRNVGVEFGIEAQLTPTITVKAAGSFGQSVYTNNPDLYLTSADFDNSLYHGSQLAFAQKHEGSPLIFGNGKTKIKDYHVAGGPEQAYQIGFEYRDPEYWFVGATSNFFSHGYVDISNIRRTSNFTTAYDGLPIGDYDKDRARELLKQEKLKDYMLVNLIGGKSWKSGDYYFGVFGVVSNLLNKEYRTGGFESSRKANFTNFNQDQSSPYGPQFGNNYFYGYGTTFYLNVYLRF